MSSRDNISVDLIEELRLRQWARRNFVPAVERCADWHPIVLAEMTFRDQELAENSPEWTQFRTAFVPLAPSGLSYLDTAHANVPAPSGLLSPRDETARQLALVDDERLAGF